jgi:hypothetical protein
MFAPAYVGRKRWAKALEFAGIEDHVGRRNSLFFYPVTNSRVPHISLVFSEMWDTTGLPHKLFRVRELRTGAPCSHRRTWAENDGRSPPKLLFRVRSLDAVVSLTDAVRLEECCRFDPGHPCHIFRLQNSNPKMWDDKSPPFRMSRVSRIHAPSGSIPSPTAGCPISRSFFARCGIPQDSPSSL